jgi:hypothetical protein
MNFKAGTGIDIAALQSCFVAVKASPSHNLKAQAAICHVTPTTYQPAAISSRGTLAQTQDSSGAFATARQV